MNTVTVLMKTALSMAAIGDKATILFDSGVRTGADFFKALALGAHAVCIGRLYSAYQTALCVSTASRAVSMIHKSFACRPRASGFPLTCAVYGMSIAGEAGVRHVMKSLLADFDILMNCAGARNMEEIRRTKLRPNPGRV